MGIFGSSAGRVAAADAFFSVEHQIGQVGAGIVWRVHPVDRRGEGGVGFIVNGHLVGEQDGVWFQWRACAMSFASRCPVDFPSRGGRCWH